jgi:predicted ribosomally synthesized peptide with nif11-like leader
MTRDSNDKPAVSREGLARALRFVRAAREDPQLAERLRTVDPAAGLVVVLRIAAEAGFEISEDELREAHARDWALRRAHYAASDD